MGRGADGGKTATCRQCEGEEPKVFKLSQNSTSPLWLHLEKAHKTEHEKIVGKKKSPVNKVVKLKQPTLFNMANKNSPYGRNHRKQKQFDENVKKQMIFDCLPFSIADSKLFRKTVHDLDPKIVVKQAKTYSRHINKEGQLVKDKIKRFVRKNGTGILALTTDMWEDRKQNSFCSLTAHFMLDDFKLKRITTAIKFFGTGRHTSENIAETVSKEIEEIKGSDGVTIVLVSDSTANMVKMRNLLKQGGVIDEELGCALHKLQNAIKDANKSTQGVKRTMTKAKKIIKFIRKSNLAANRLKKACSKTGHKCKKLKKYMEIRWNAEFDALDMLKYHQECLEEMDRTRDLDKVSNYVLNRDDWRRLEALLDILKPVKVLTKILETQADPSINRLSEGLYNLDEGLKAESENLMKPPVTRAYAKNLRRHLKERFPSYGLKQKVVLLGNFLDPHLKGVHIEKAGMMVTAAANVKEMISQYNAPQPDDNVDQRDSQVSDEEEITATEKLLRSVPRSSVFDEEQTSGQRAAQEELDIFKKLPRCPRSKDILEWWSEHESMLPRLSILAKWTLCIPAGSAASEQLFSIAGLFDTVRRGRLNTEIFELMTLQKSNQKTLETLDAGDDDSSDEEKEDENQNSQENDTVIETEEESETEEDEQQEEGFQALFDGETDGSDSESDRPDDVEDNESDFE